MSDVQNKVRKTVSEKRVKLHVFSPSNRRIWTIVGRGAEHWIDPIAEYCSCPGFYFGKLDGKKDCYHLDSVKLAQKEEQFETVRFSDQEYPDFLAGLISDL